MVEKYELEDIPEKFDAVIPVARKDFTKLPLVVDLLFKNVPVNTIYIVSPEPVFKEHADKLTKHNVVFLGDQTVLPIDPSIFQSRPHWVYLQFIKLQSLQNITETEWYIAVDADLFALKRLPFVVNGRPGLFYARDREKVVDSYTRFSEELFGFSWSQFSLMNDIALYNKSVTKSMVDSLGGHEAFVERVAEICAIGYYPADAQLYYAWVHKMYPDLYDVRTVSNECAGMYGEYEYTPDKVEEAVTNSINAGHVDTFSLHSWSL